MIYDLRFAICAAASTFAICYSSFGQGALTPPGAPGPTMKSLDQIEARRPISSAPFLIVSPGSYYLTTNISVSSGTAISIDVSGVTLDLNGFTISSTAPSGGSGSGILLSSGSRDITIANGHIRSSVVDSGGVYSGNGFAYGIFYSLNAPGNVLVSHVTVSGCLFHGIYLGTGDSTVVESCTVRTVGSEGIYASTIKDSSATDCGGDAIYGDQVSNCHGQATGTGIGVNALSTALNCNGSSSGGPGINAFAALNCYGNSTNNSGVFASSTAQNCYGTSTSGIGIAANLAQNCYGVTGSSWGIFATSTTQNCYGIATNGTGLSTEIAGNCQSFSVTGTGLSAYIANSCLGQSSSGTAESVTFKYNMP